MTVESIGIESKESQRLWGRSKMMNTKNDVLSKVRMTNVRKDD